MSNDDRPEFCSFCHRGLRDAYLSIAVPGAAICQDCVQFIFKGFARHLGPEWEAEPLYPEPEFPRGRQ